jgi:hypothetical protein
LNEEGEPFFQIRNSKVAKRFSYKISSGADRPTSVNEIGGYLHSRKANMTSHHHRPVPDSAIAAIPKSARIFERSIRNRLHQLFSALATDGFIQELSAMSIDAIVHEGPFRKLIQDIVSEYAPGSLKFPQFYKEVLHRMKKNGLLASDVLSTNEKKSRGNMKKRSTKVKKKGANTEDIFQSLYEEAQEKRNRQENLRRRNFEIETAECTFMDEVEYKKVGIPWRTNPFQYTPIINRPLHIE